MFRNRVLIVMFSCLLYVDAGGFTRGKMEWEMERIVECEGKRKSTLPFHVSCDRCNRTHKCLHGNITFLHDWDDSTTLELSTKKWSDGGWKSNAFGIKLKNPCQTIERIFVRKDYHQVLTLMNMTCPPRKGTYILPNEIYATFRRTQSGFDPVHNLYLMYGKFGTTAYMESGNEHFCKVFIYEVKP